LVLSTAARLFSENGYQATTTKQIAEESGVGESVVFRHFRSKADIFEVAIASPFTEFMDDWAAKWDVALAGESDPADGTRAFVKGFYELATEHRDLLRTLMAAPLNGGDPPLAEVATRVTRRLADHLRVMQSVLLHHAEARQLRGLDVPVSVAVSAGSVLALVLLDDWVFPSTQRRPGRDRQIEELTQMLLHGVLRT
jgi:AcrR family transcriptional regulator